MFFWCSRASNQSASFACRHANTHQRTSNSHARLLAANNPYEPAWHTMELPLDPHLTDQWPFFATGRRHKGYFDVRTDPGQKAASGGVALLLQDGSPHHFSTPDKEALSGTIAFKDSNIYDNSPKGLSCCYFHENTASQRCLSDYELL